MLNLKASRKLSVLQKFKFLKRNTLDLLYKITVRSEIYYAFLFANNLKLTDLVRLDRRQYRAAKLVTGALHFTSREELNFLGLSFFSVHLYLYLYL
jgi:hypothetical protein